ncbi:MAG: hypothetical protein JW751_23200 [Polyangiaceae bacterium]|nr:hypothetical protein [Polyangiaceae bacterium]
MKHECGVKADPAPADEPLDLEGGGGYAPANLSVGLRAEGKDGRASHGGVEDIFDFRVLLRNPPLIRDAAMAGAFRVDAA